MVLESVSCGRGVWWIFVQFKGGFGIFKGVGVEFGAVKFRGSGFRFVDGRVSASPAIDPMFSAQLSSALNPAHRAPKKAHKQQLG